MSAVTHLIRLHDGRLRDRVRAPSFSSGRRVERRKSVTILFPSVLVAVPRGTACARHDPERERRSRSRTGVRGRDPKLDPQQSDRACTAHRSPRGGGTSTTRMRRARPSCSPVGREQYGGQSRRVFVPRKVRAPKRERWRERQRAPTPWWKARTARALTNAAARDHGAAH